jgi:hypothetical protein
MVQPTSADLISRAARAIGLRLVVPSRPRITADLARLGLNKIKPGSWLDQHDPSVARLAVTVHGNTKYALFSDTGTGDGPVVIYLAQLNFPQIPRSGATVNSESVTVTAISLRGLEDALKTLPGDVAANLATAAQLTAQTAVEDYKIKLNEEYAERMGIYTRAHAILNTPSTD